MNPWLMVGVSALAAGAAGLAAFSPMRPGSQLVGSSTWHTGNARKLALTFDDGPNPAITPRLLSLLEKYHAKASFFLVGKYVRESPGLVKELAAQGHVIGNHTETHPNLLFCSARETTEELLRCTEAIQNVTWTQPRWFRPPFGFRNPWLTEIVHRQGMRTAMWTLIPGDWRVKPSAWLIEKMKPVADAATENIPKLGQGIKARPGDIICLHDGDYARPNADRNHTVSALEYWLPRWRDLGLQFVTMDEI